MYILLLVHCFKQKNKSIKNLKSAKERKNLLPSSFVWKLMNCWEAINVLIGMKINKWQRPNHSNRIKQTHNCGYNSEFKWVRHKNCTMWNNFYTSQVLDPMFFIMNFTKICTKIFYNVKLSYMTIVQRKKSTHL